MTPEERGQLRHMLARQIREAVEVGPLGPNSLAISERGGIVRLNLTEADQAACVVLPILLDAADRADAESARAEAAEARVAALQVLAAGWEARGGKIEALHAAECVQLALVDPAEGGEGA